MADMRSEVLKALPYLSENIMSLLLMHLFKLGVEEPHDMMLLKESDFECILKVVQSRKLLNHFQAVFGYNNTQISNALVPSKVVPESSSCYHNPTSSSTSTSYIDSVKALSRSTESRHAPYACTNALTPCIQSDTKHTLVTPNSTVLSAVTIPPFTISPAFTISEHSSTSEEHNNALRTFVTSNVTSNYVPFTLENNMREPTPILKSMAEDLESVSTFQATSNVKEQDVSEVEAPSYSDQSGSYEISPCKQSLVDKDISDESENVFSNYQLPIHKFSAKLLKILENKQQIQKPFSHELVRAITTDLLNKCSNPTVRELSIVAKAAVNAYPEALSDITSGRNSKPGYESFLNMIYNRVNNCKYSGNEKPFIPNEIEPLKPRRSVGRPKGSKRSQTSETTSPTAYSLALSEPAYRIPLKDLPQEIQDHLKHNKCLSDSSKCLVIQTVADDLLKGNNKPNQEALKLVAKSVITTYPGSLKSGKDTTKSEIDFFEGLVNEIKNRDLPVNAKKLRNEESGVKSSALLTTNHNGFQKNTTVNLVQCDVKELTPFNRWNMLRNYKVPMEKLPLYIQKDLKDQVPIEEEIRDEFIEVIIHDALQIISQPTRDDLKVIAKAIVKAYPNSFQMRVKNNRFTYLGFLKKLMEISVNITGDGNLAFTHRVKKCRVQNTKHDDNISGISKNEMDYFQSLKGELQTLSKNEDWSSYIADAMSTTFPLQRLEIKDGVVVKELKESWPFLFHEKGFLLHMRLLFGSCLKKKMEQNFRDKHNTLLNHFVKQSEKQDNVRAVLAEMLMSNNVHYYNRRVVLLILDYFEENQLELSYKFQNHKEDMRALPFHPCIITFDNPTSPAESSFSVCMQRTLLVRDVPFTTAFIIYFGTYLVFNLPYPPSLSRSLEFVQRCLAEIPVREGIPVSRDITEKVDILLKDIQFVI